LRCTQLQTHRESVITQLETKPNVPRLVGSDTHLPSCSVPLPKIEEALMNNQWPRRANTSQGDIIMLAEEVQVMLSRKNRMTGK
jgi:hypothetical protein